MQLAKKESSASKVELKTHLAPAHAYGLSAEYVDNLVVPLYGGANNEKDSSPDSQFVYAVGTQIVVYDYATKKSTFVPRPQQLQVTALGAGYDKSRGVIAVGERVVDLDDDAPAGSGAASSSSPGKSLTDASSELLVANYCVLNLHLAMQHYLTITWPRFLLSLHLSHSNDSIFFIYNFMLQRRYS